MRALQPICLIGFSVTVSASFWLADIASGSHTLMPHWLGTLTWLQFSLAALFMLGAWAGSAVGNPLSDYRWILLTGIIIRLVLIPVDSYTSNDIDRYLWDGSVAVAGYDPYRTSPDSTEAAPLREHWPTPPEHARYATVYPPLAIATFAAVASVGPDYAHISWKLLTTAAGMLTLMLAVQLLSRAGRLRHLALVALSPILILETGVGAHLDSLSTLAVTAALLSLQQRRYVWVGILIGIGTLYKLLPVFLLLPVLCSLPLRQSARTIGAAAATVVSGYASAVLIGMQPIGVISTFFEKWRFGSPLFNLLESVLSGSMLIAVIILLLTAGAILIYRMGSHRQIPAMQWSLALPLLLSPVVFPWYLMILVPLTALAPNAFFIGWLCVLPLTYEVLGGFASDRSWMPASWPLITLAVVWITALVYGSLSGKFPKLRKTPGADLAG